MPTGTGEGLQPSFGSLSSQRRRTLQARPADTPLVKYLCNPEYMKIILVGKKNPGELSAQLEAASLGVTEGLQADNDCNLPLFRALMKLPTFPDRVVRSLGKPVERAQSN